MSISQAPVIDQDLKFIQLKKYQLSQVNHFGTGVCLAVDQRNQIIFVCCQDELIYVPLVLLLNFEFWNKDFLKNVENIDSGKITIKIRDGVISHLISISSKGYGSKLAVACYDSTKLTLFFYNLHSLYENENKSVPYNHFIFPVTASFPTKVRFLSWHPEINDNLLACMLNDGSFYILYIGDQNSLILLVHLSNNHNISAFSWSPKGKQIMISYKNSCFTQFKLILNENNLVKNSTFQETKRIQLPDCCNNFTITNIFWLSTFKILILCRNVENNIRFLLVSIPSPKISGPMKILDFGSLVLESIDSPDPFEEEIYSLENIIFTYTNKSSDIAMIGCHPTTNEPNNRDNLSEIIIEDDYRLTCDDQVLIRGLNFVHGTPKQFKFHSTVKGGLNNPFALTYNSLGQLILFLVDYEDIKNEKFLKVPNAPKCSKLNVDINTAQEVIPVSDNVETSKPITTAIETIQSNFAPVFTMNTNQLINNQSSISSSSNITTTTTNTITVDSKSNMNLFNKNTPEKPLQQELNKNQSNIAISKIDATKNSDAKQIKNLYIEEILLNIKDFETQLKSSISSLKDILKKTEIGANKEHENIKYDSEFVIEILQKLLSYYGSLNHDVNDLQASCLELQYLLEETRSLLDRNVDPKYKYILQQRNLDPLTCRRMKEINTLKDYIEIQLRELNIKFDLEWQEWLQKKKRSPSSLLSMHSNVRSPATSPYTSFMSNSKINQDDSLDEDIMGKNFISVIYKALVNNHQLIDNLKKQIRIISKKVSIVKKHDFLPEIDGKCQEDRDLAKMLSQVLLISNQPTHIDTKKTIIIQCLPLERKFSLKSFLENRHSVPIRVCRLYSNDNEFNLKSRFISVLEKIKEKKSKENQQQIITDIMKTDKIQNVPNKEINTSNITKKEETQETDIIVTNVTTATTTTITTTRNSKPEYSITTVTKSYTTTSLKSPVKSDPISFPDDVPTVSFKLPTTTNIETKVTLPIPKANQSLNLTTDIPIISSPNENGEETSEPLISTFSKESTEQKTNVVSSNKPIMSTNLNFPTVLFSEDNSSQNVSLSPKIKDESKNSVVSTNIITSALTNNSNNVTISTTSVITTSVSVSSIFSKLPSFSTSMFDNSKSDQQPCLSNATLAKSSQNDSVKFTSTLTTTKSALLPLPNVNNSTSSLNTFTTNSVFSSQSWTGFASSTTTKSDQSTSFSFTDSLAILNKFNEKNLTTKDNNENKPTITATTSIPSNTTNSNISSFFSTTSTVVTTNSVLSPFTALKPSIPSFSNSLFEATKPTFPSNQESSTNNNIQNKTVTSSSNGGESPFSFNSSLSSLSLMNNSEVDKTTSTINTTVQQSNVFDSFSKTSKPLFFGTTQSQSDSFNFLQKPLTTTISNFGNFSFSNNSTLQINNSSSNWTFGQQQNQSFSSIFSPTTSSFLSSQPKLFDGQSFASSPSLLSSGTTGTTGFGGNAVFRGPLSFGSLGFNSSFTGTESNHSFGSMMFKNEPMPSFDSLANENKGSSSTTSFGSGGGSYFSRISQNNSDAAFTQRRG